MQEGQITVGDETIHLPETFWVLATQNPIEHEGTYPLPEAQLDRFLMKLLVGYPDRASELLMLDLPSVSDSSRPESEAVVSERPPLYGPADVIAFRGLRLQSGSPLPSRNTSSTSCGPHATPPLSACPWRPF